jgi:hypothetical protein
MAKTHGRYRFSLLLVPVACGLGALLLCVAEGTAASAKSDSDSVSKASAGPRTETVEFFLDGFHIDKKYLSMRGPQKKLHVKSKFPAEEKAVWIKSMAVAMLDEKHAPISDEYLCHAWFGYRSAKGGGMMTVSQGTMGMTLPDGFAFRMPNGKNVRMVLTGMVENNNYDEIDQSAAMKYTIGYYGDEEAKKFGVKELIPLNMVGRPEAEPFHPHMHIKEGMNHHHWLVPPGRHTYRSSIVRPKFTKPGSPLGLDKDTRIHFLRVHLHGYGESVALIDKTAKKTVWTGYARNAQGIRHIVSTDFYSDVDGLPLYHDHEYELEVVYDNPTTEPIDAMGALRAFVAVP